MDWSSVLILTFSCLYTISVSVAVLKLLQQFRANLIFISEGWTLLWWADFPMFR